MKTIGILNESTLHKQLKTMFSTDGAKTEKYIDKYICDIVCADGKIIEIQTSNLSKLRNKLVVLLDNHKIEIIFPILLMIIILIVRKAFGIKKHFFYIKKKLMIKKLQKIE